MQPVQYRHPRLVPLVVVDRGWNVHIHIDLDGSHLLVGEGELAEGLHRWLVPDEEYDEREGFGPMTMIRIAVITQHAEVWIPGGNRSSGTAYVLGARATQGTWNWLMTIETNKLSSQCSASGGFLLHRPRSRQAPHLPTQPVRRLVGPAASNMLHLPSVPSRRRMRIVALLAVDILVLVLVLGGPRAARASHPHPHPHLQPHPPQPRTYHSHHYYALQLDPLARNDPQAPIRAATQLGVELVERVGQLPDHWLARVPKRERDLRLHARTEQP